MTMGMLWMFVRGRDDGLIDTGRKQRPHEKMGYGQSEVRFSAYVEAKRGGTHRNNNEYFSGIGVVFYSYSLALNATGLTIVPRILSCPMHVYTSVQPNLMDSWPERTFFSRWAIASRRFWRTSSTALAVSGVPPPRTLPCGGIYVFCWFAATDGIAALEEGTAALGPPLP